MAEFERNNTQAEGLFDRTLLYRYELSLFFSGYTGYDDDDDDSIFQNLKFTILVHFGVFASFLG